MRRAAAATVMTFLVLAGCQPDQDDPSPGGATGTATTPVETTSPPAPTTDEQTATVTQTVTAEPTGTDDVTSGSAPEPTETSAAEPTATSPDVALPDWTTAPVEESAAPTAVDAQQEIVDVRTGRHEGFDRVVLDLTGDEPVLGWFARFVDRPAEAASGRPMEVEGEAFLELGVHSIDWTRDAPERYDGGPVAGEGTEVVTEVVFGVLFEGQQQIVVGLRDQTAYRVFALSDPARIVVDVRHP